MLKADIRLSGDQEEGYQEIRVSGTKINLISRYPDNQFLITRYPDNRI